MPSETCWCGHTLEEHAKEIPYCVAMVEIDVEDRPAEPVIEAFLCPCSMFLPAHDVKGLEDDLDLPVIP